jgi:rRNA-processing protein EBP2
MSHSENKKKKICKNDVHGLEQKLRELTLNIPSYSGDIPFIETLVVISESPLEIENPNDDLDRESKFYKQALQCVSVASELFSQDGLPYKRPDDFFAEMIKSDDHMHKVKSSLLREKRVIDEAQERRKIRTQKKYGKQVQQNVLSERKKQRDSEKDAIKNWMKMKKSNLVDDADLEVLFDPNEEKNNRKKKS